MIDSPEILLIDTTILYSGLAYNGVEHKVIKSGKFLFVTTDLNIVELQRVIKRNLGWEDSKINELIRNASIMIFTQKVYGRALQKADFLIGKRDKADVPLVALALSIESDGIFTSDSDFEEVEKIFKLWKGRELLALI